MIQETHEWERSTVDPQSVDPQSIVQLDAVGNRAT